MRANTCPSNPKNNNKVPLGNTFGRLYVTGNDGDNNVLTDSGVLAYETGYRWQHSPHFSLEEIMFAGQNLLNSSQPQYVAELHTPLTEIERGFYVKMTWRF